MVTKDLPHTTKLTFWNNIFIIHNIITLVTPVILNISWFFLFIYLFSCIFININVASGHWVNKKKYFGCLHYHRYIHNDWYDSPYPIFALNFSSASVVKFRASRYIMRPNQTSKWKVMTIWISRDLPLFNLEHLDILCARIWHPS